MRSIAHLLSLAVFAFLGACSVVRPTTVPTSPGEPVATTPTTVPAAASTGPGEQIAASAALQLGTPYRFGGSDPATGFDCSGLVSFVHAGAGIRVPRTAAAQSAAARAVPREHLQIGDLVFFRSRGGEIDHVAIYAGDGQMLHAPGRGRVVERIRLDDPWFRTRYAGAGRFWTAPAAADR